MHEQWADHIAKAIKQANNALNAIKLIRKNFNQKELLQLVTYNFYSILLYNSEIWHLPTLKPTLKQKLLSASVKALKLCLKINNNEISFVSIHAMANRATPEQMMKYKLALCLYKLYNNNYNTREFVLLNFNQTFNARQICFNITRSNNIRVGINSLANRLHSINCMIPLP